MVVARGGKQIIHGIDLEIPSGQITALLGANGAGKSSTVLAISGALPLVAGEVTVNGKSTKGLRPESVRQLGVAPVRRDTTFWETCPSSIICALLGTTCRART